MHLIAFILQELLVDPVQSTWKVCELPSQILLKNSAMSSLSKIRLDFVLIPTAGWNETAFSLFNPCTHQSHTTYFFRCTWVSRTLPATIGAHMVSLMHLKQSSHNDKQNPNCIKHLCPGSHLVKCVHMC